MLSLQLSLLPVTCYCYLILWLPVYISVSAMRKDNETNNNLTSCEEFLNNSKLDLIKLVEEDWKIFYFWTEQYEDSYNIRFSIPSSMLVRRFEVELADEVRPPVNWSRAELFMETAVDFSALYIRTETPGLYKIVPSLAFEVKTRQLPKFALKMVDPGYLAIVNCEFRMCYALAPARAMPTPDEIPEAVARLGLASESGRSYLSGPPPAAPAVPLVPRDVPRHQEDDAEDDVQDAVEIKENEF